MPARPLHRGQSEDDELADDDEVDEVDDELLEVDEESEADDAEVLRLSVR